MILRSSQIAPPVFSRGKAHLLCLLSLAAEVGRGRAALEEAGEEGLHQGAEDDLGAAVGRSVQLCEVSWHAPTYAVCGRAIQMMRTNLKV